ncbi:MAG: TIGR02147 family protein [Bdellovibrionales bacterium]
MDVVQAQIQSLLMRELTHYQLRNPAYSLRAFSKKLGISHSALSEILRGRRKVSAKMVSRFAERLSLPPQEVARILTPTQSTGSSPRQALQLASDQFYFVSEWYYFALLSALERDKTDGKPSSLAEYFGLNLKTVTAALERMARLGLLEKRVDCYAPTGKSFASTDGVVSASIRKNHLQGLELARLALEGDEITDRDFSSMTMAIDPKKIPEAKRRVRQFQDDLCQWLEGGKRTEVYRLNIQMFSLKGKGRKYG